MQLISLMRRHIFTGCVTPTALPLLGMARLSRALDQGKKNSFVLSDNPQLAGQTYHSLHLVLTEFWTGFIVGLWVTPVLGHMGKMLVGLHFI